MKVYQLTFMDVERGKIRRWKRNKREITRFLKDWEQRWPLRKLLLTESIQIPDNKDEFLQWLNCNCGGD